MSLKSNNLNQTKTISHHKSEVFVLIFLLKVKRANSLQFLIILEFWVEKSNHCNFQKYNYMQKI